MKILKVLLVVILLGALGAGLYFGYEPLPDPTEPVLLLPTFGEAPDLSVTGYNDYSSRFITVAEAGMAPGATEAEKLEAAYAIYRVGCYTYFTAPYRAERIYGGGGAFTANEAIGGFADVFQKSYKVNLNDGNKYSYYGYFESFAQLYEARGVPGNIASIVGALITFSDKETTSPEGMTFWEGIKGSAIIDGNGATGMFRPQDIVFKSQAELNAENNKKIDDGRLRVYDESWWDEYGHDSPEKTQHTINKNTIDPSSIVISKKSDKNGDYYYSVEFDVICNEESTGFEANNLKAISSLVKSIRYDYLRINVEVYESGYMRRWNSKEAWIGELDVYIGVFGGVSASNADTYMSYNKNVVLQGLEEHWFGDFLDTII